MNRQTGDLSSTFGAAAAGLAPTRRRRRNPAHNGSRDEDHEPTTDEGTDEPTAGVPAETSAETPAETPAETTDGQPPTTGPDTTQPDTTQPDTTTDESGTEPMRTETGATRRGRPARRRTTAPAGRRPPPRRRPLRIRDPHQLDLLLLAVVERRPGNGHAVHDLLRELSGGAFDPTIQGILRRLRRLTSNRLVTRDTRDRHYVLTPLGERILAAWRREWAAYSAAVDGVVTREDGDADRATPN